MIYTTFTLLEIAKGHLMYFTLKNIESILQFIKYEQIYSQYSSIYHKRAFQGFQENVFLYFSRFFKVFLESYLFSRFSRSLFGIQGFSRFLQVFQGSGHSELLNTDHFCYFRHQTNVKGFSDFPLSVIKFQG